MTENDDSIPTSTVGDRLRAAREKKKLSLDDIANQTRIPLRHLQNLEAGDWSALPAPTYTMGFAKSYASAVGLDRTEIGDDLRAEMGGQRYEAGVAEVFEPADPARTMPKWLVLAAIGGIILVVVLMSWLNNRSLDGEEAATAVEATATVPSTDNAVARTQAQQQQAAQPATGAVVLTATEPAWIQVTDGGKTLFSGELAAGQTFAVPADAAAPLLKAGKPEALRVTVGNSVAPPVGPPGRVASKVSLKASDLMAAGAAGATPPAASAPPVVQNTAG
jgi:cytoskeleton protein RodZ